MAVKKWSWTTANPYTNDPGISNSYVKLGATAAETKKAYNALVKKGATSDFSYKVWNDLCAKIYDLNKDWQTNNYFGHTWPSVWMKSPIISDYPDEETYEYENGVSGGTKGRITPFMINMAARCLIPTAVRPWSTKLGRDEIKTGDICYAEYFLWIANTLNHWCDLTPAWWKFSDQFKWKTKCDTDLDSSVLIYPKSQKAVMGVVIPVQLDTSILMRMSLKMKYKLSADEIAVLESLHVSSLMNFHTLNIKCTVWDKIPIYFQVDFNAKQEGTARFTMLPPELIRAVQSYSLQMKICARMASELLAMGIRLSMQQGATILPDVADSYSFPVDGKLSDIAGKMKIRSLRPLPFSARASYSSEMSCLIEYEGIELIDMEDEAIHFADTIGLDTTDSEGMHHTGGVVLSQEDIPICRDAAVGLENGAEQIVFHESTVDGISGITSTLTHTARVASEGNQAIQKVQSDAFSHEGVIHGMAGLAEMSFANEETITMQKGTFGVANGEINLSFQDTQAMAISDNIDTAESIVLGDAPPLETEAEGEFATRSAAALARNRVIENAAETVIQVIESGEISFGLNSNLEIENIAATISSVAGLAVKQMSGFEAEADVETVEKAVVITVARKLAEGTISVGTEGHGELIQRLMRFVESPLNIIRTESDSVAAKSLPKEMRGKTSVITSGSDAFMDASYVRGDSLIADAMIRLNTDVSPALVEDSAFLTALALISFYYAAGMERSPVQGLDGNALAQTDSEAGVVLARSVLILASAVEDNLVTENDDIFAADFERILTFES